jgi:hypothetical protein
MRLGNCSAHADSNTAQYSVSVRQTTSQAACKAWWLLYKIANLGNPEGPACRSERRKHVFQAWRTV